MSSFRSLMLAALALPLLPGALLAQATAAPDVVAQLGLTDVETRSHWGEGRHVRGTLPGGARVELDLHRDGRLEEIETENGGFPLSAVETLLPEPVRANPAYPGDAVLRKLEWDDDRIEMDGETGDGREFEAEFGMDGRLIEMDAEG